MKCTNLRKRRIFFLKNGRLVEETTVAEGEASVKTVSEGETSVTEGKTVSGETVSSVTGEDGAVSDGQRSAQMTTKMTSVTVMNQRSRVDSVGGGVRDRLHGNQRSVRVVVGHSSWGVQKSGHGAGDGEEGGESLIVIIWLI